MIKKDKVILIHGAGGECDGKRHWFPYIKEKLEQKRINVLAPDFPDPVNPRLDAWLHFLENECSPDENSIIIGHSYGAALALRYCEYARIKGLVLVAGFFTDLNDPGVQESNFVSKPWKLDAIVRNTQWRVQFHSQDDPYISIEEAKSLSNSIDSEFYEFEHAMHFGVDGINPYNEFPELYEVLAKKLSLT